MKKISEGNKNILIVSDRNLFPYGTQVSILNIIKHASGCSFTWYCPGGREKEFTAEVNQAGVEVVSGDLDLKCCGRKVIHQTIVRDIWKLCHNKHYDIIHVNSNLMGTMALSLSVARLCGVPCRIAHSHSNNTFARGTYMRRIMLRTLISFSAIRFVACSELAAEFMFGIKKMHNAEIFPNAIDLGKYTFSRSKRSMIRKELDLVDEQVFGHVGGFRVEKNHNFLLDVFYVIVKRNSKTRLLLIGDGELGQQIRQRAKEYSIDDKVIFVGQTDQVDEFLCAMDIFIFPSIFEGLGFACVEAQASGLPCLVSDIVPQEVKRTDNVRFLSLDLGPEKWADELLNIPVPNEEEREKAWKEIAGTPYDLDSLGKYVEKLYEMP